MMSHYESWQKILQFSIYTAYVSWTFENMLYETKIIILIIVSIYMQG